MSILLIKPITEYADYDVELLEPLRRRKLEACKRDTKKLEIIAAGALLREALVADGYPVDGPLELEYHCYGKPYLADRARQFSVSHSGDYVVCAVDNEEIGVDIEKIQTVNLRVAERILNERELAEFYVISEEAKKEELIRLWTRKESVAKCLGGGIFRNPKELPMEEFKIRTERYGDYYVSFATKK